MPPNYISTQSPIKAQPTTFNGGDLKQTTMTTENETSQISISAVMNRTWKILLILGLLGLHEIMRWIDELRSLNVC